MRERERERERERDGGGERENMHTSPKVEQQTYSQTGLLCTPQNFAQSPIFRNKIFFGTKVISDAFFKHFPKFAGHTSSGSHTNITLNLLTKL